MSKRTARIFLSSTFRDFGEERDLLVRKVFPALRNRLKDRFVELVDVDLRWGITADQAERGEVLPICLAEIDRSRPFFVGLLGERYGWVPEKGKYPPELVEQRPWLKKHQGGKSVTELEILHGVLNNPKMTGRALFYFRSAAYANQKGGDYLPQSVEDRTRQRDLKARIRDSGFPVVQGYKDPEALAKRLERDLWKILDEMYPADEVPDAFTREGYRHEAYAVPRRRLYLGGESYIEALDNALVQGRQRVLVEGASGGGKSALIANWLERRAKKHRKELVHVHYLGATAEASDPQALVRRLIEAIKRLTESTEEIPSDPQALYDSLSTWIAIAHAYAGKRKTKVLIVLDALNGLRDLQDLRWFPEFLPERVRVVVSCLPGPVHEALLTKSDWERVEVTPLDTVTARELFVAYLKRYNKELPDQLLSLALSHPLSTNPLFLRTLAEELRLFGVHEQLKDRLTHYLTSKTVDDLFERVLERVEKDCGAKQVRKAMEGIWASRAGLSEHEIQGFANLKPAEWAPIRHALDDSLLESGGRITFAHDYMRLAVSDRYLKGNNTLQDEGQSSEAIKLRNKAHVALARWFAMSKSLERRAEEEPYQWSRAGQWRKLLLSLVSWPIISRLGNEELQPIQLTEYWIQLAQHYQCHISVSYRKALPTYPINRMGRSSAAKFYNELAAFLIGIDPLEGLVDSLLGKAVSICRSRLGPSHEATLDVELNLLSLYAIRGDFTIAEKYLAQLVKRHNLKGKSSRNSNRNTRYCDILMAAGNLSYDQRRTLEAEKLFHDALSGYCAKFGSDHKNSLTAASNLIAAMVTNGKIKEGMPLLEKINKVAATKFGRRAPITIVNQFNAAKLCIDLGLFKKAGKILKDVMDRDKETFGPRSENFARDLELYGVLLLKLGKTEHALEQFEQALKIIQLIRGRNHPRLAQVFSNLSDVYFSREEYKKAQEYLVSAVNLMASNQPDGSEGLARYLKKLGIVMILAQTDSQLAENYFKRALDLYQRFIGSAHPETLDMMNLLADWRIMNKKALLSVQHNTSLRSQGYQFIEQVPRMRRSLLKKRTFQDFRGRKNSALIWQRS